MMMDLTPTTFQRIPVDQFQGTLDSFTELSSEALGGQVVSVSDEFFAEAFHLLLQEPAPSLRGQFGPNGALYSGWESRRHNPSYDWCIIRLGTTGVITGFDVDTSHFSGNEAPQVSVEVLYGSPSEIPKTNDQRWTTILPKVDLGPDSRHLFKVQSDLPVNYVKLNMYPDGGIARFRVYGRVSPVIPSNASDLFDMAHVFAGGRVEFMSDQHFGVGANLILPGRGKDMGGGWETKRSRDNFHKDWVVIKLGIAGYLDHAEIDTAHFKGNFPESCEIRALYVERDINWKMHDEDTLEWALVLPRTKLGPHRQQYFQLENVENRLYTHIKLTIYPDGGLQRIRIIGRRSNGVPTSVYGLGTSKPIGAHNPTITDALLRTHRTVPVLPLTPEAFSPFGEVIQAYEDLTAAPKGVKVTSANAGTATKFHKISILESSYPFDAGATSGISVYRCQPCTKITDEGFLELKILERHRFTNQAFIAMGPGLERGAESADPCFLVVVALNGADDRPDIHTLRAFVASTGQGIVYNTSVWHQPMTVLNQAIDFACVETQVGNGGIEDCEIIELAGTEVVNLRFQL